MIQGTEELRAAYRNDAVARQYVDERFRQPLGALLHARQAAALRNVLSKTRPARVMEIAPGPARLTIETLDLMIGRGVMVDASAQMLAEGHRRLGKQTAWRGIQGDVFALPFACEFDFVYAFRLIRHFERRERLLIYEQIRSVLKRDGLLVFDAVNASVSGPLRAAAKPSEYAHFDALLRPEELHDELETSGFCLESLKGVQHQYAVLRRLQVLVAPRSRWLARGLMECIDRVGGEPLEWIVVCRRV